MGYEKKGMEEEASLIRPERHRIAEARRARLRATRWKVR